MKTNDEATSQKDELARDVGVLGAVGMGLGSIVGTGVFVSLAIAAGVAGENVIAATAIAAALATANGLSSAQLAAAHPVSGGTYEYGYKFVHPLAGFSAGLMYLLAKSASAATAALGAMGYFLHAAGFEVDHTIYVGLSLALVFVITALVAAGVRRSNLINGAIVAVTFFSLLCFIGFGSLEIKLEHFEGLGVRDSDSMVSLLSASALMFVAYTGYGRIATLGEEVKRPEVTIPRAIIATLVVTMLLYMAVSTVAVGVAGADLFSRSAGETGSPLEQVALMLRHPWIAIVVSIGAVTAMTGVLLNLVLGLSRVVLAMGRRRDLPSALSKVDTKSKSPTRAVWFMGGVVAVLVAIGDVTVTWSFSAFTVLLYYAVTNLAALRLPKEYRRFPRVVSVVGLLGCAGLAFFVDWRVWPFGLGILFAGWLARVLPEGPKPRDLTPQRRVRSCQFP